MRAKGFWFDKLAADRAVEFIETYCRHVKGEWAGNNFQLEEWQKNEIVRPLFGWKRPDGTRRYRLVYIEIPRKNGKSSLGAAIALYLLFSDGEPGAEVYSAASDRDQAAIVFDVAKSMVELEPAMNDRAEIYRRSIYVKATNSWYHVLSADVKTKHGKNSHGVVFDELHAQPDRHLYDVLRTSTSARQQPVMVMFTTAGFDRDSVCWEVHEYAVKVLDGIIEDDSFLAVIYAAKENADWTDPQTWADSNPNLGVSKKPSYMEDECRLAIESAAQENSFKRLDLNIWTEQAIRWIKKNVWDRCGRRVVDPVALEGMPCYAGLDLGSTSDLTALVQLFPLDDGSYDLLAHFWCPEEVVAEQRKKGLFNYANWVDAGYITATEGNVTDKDFVEDYILSEVAPRYKIEELAFDRMFADQLTTHLADEGLVCVPFGQGFLSMAGPTKEFDRLLLSGKLNHGNNPVLNWMASNVAVLQDPAGNKKPAKNKSSGKIDGIVAAVMALGRAMVANVASESVYATRPRIDFI